MHQHEDESSEDFADVVDAHLGHFFADGETMVFHEIVSDIIHCDVYFVQPAADRPFNLLVTGGMSSLPMHVPEELTHLQYAEVMILLPGNWKLGQEDFKDEANYWPVRTLKKLARFPHENETWLGWGHTIPFWADGDDDSAGHGFAGIMLIDSITLPEDFITIHEVGKEVNIYSVIPLYAEEMDYKIKHGANSLLEKMDEYSIEEIVRVGRTNVCR